ncbi:L,D-transpeptidase family protein [Gemmobacter serpentinus]|uniref:L,D-transpeptidase family protein n=1 Tax=Gemmobacter serpentinus TaxID=2652247 RepID=UPI00124DF967|nr:L,D-transpeptidase family protein [Gemmobacter serpentinus]
MAFLRILLLVGLAFGLAACGGGDKKFRTYRGPAVTTIQVHKADRKMYLLHKDKVLKQYDIDLGFAPVGHKQFEGDGKTPEGAYYITHHNPKSRYHLSVGVSYPDALDRAYAASQGKSPGGDIMIHGRSDYKGTNKGDWTAGCIAVTDKEIEEIYSMLRQYTPIYILP